MRLRTMVCTGHYRDKMGAKNATLKLHEWQIMYLLTGYLYDQLHLKNCDCDCMTDNKLTDKVKRINLMGYDLALDLHMNAYKGSSLGHLCMYWRNSQKSKNYALCINESMNHNKTRSLIQVNSLTERGAYFLSKTNCSAVIVEIGFIDCLTDLQTCLINVGSIADNIASGVVKGYYSNMPQDEKNTLVVRNGVT